MLATLCSRVGRHIRWLTASGRTRRYLARRDRLRSRPSTGSTLAVTVALYIAELGSRLPLTGGTNSIVARVLGTQAAFPTLLSYNAHVILLPPTASCAEAEQC